jgi:hypothetical protein
MYQIAFSAGLLGAVVAWLMLNRDGLTVLLRPETRKTICATTASMRSCSGPSCRCGLRLSNNRAKQFDGAPAKALRK